MLYAASCFARNGTLIVFDMASQHEIEALQLAPVYYFSSARYNFNLFKIETSLNGIDYTVQGSYTKTVWQGSSTNPEVVNLVFYGTVRAGYIRISGERIVGFGGLSEFNGFK